MDRIRHFLLSLRDRLLKGEQRDPKWGAFLASDRVNMDEFGVELLGCKRSLGFRGSRSHEVPGKFDKRYATICLCVRAEGEQPPKIHIILHGKGTIIRKLNNLPGIKMLLFISMTVHGKKRSNTLRCSLKWVFTVVLY